MKTTCELLDAVKARHNVPSDYALAKKLEVTQQEVSKYRTGKATLGDSTAIRLAQLLEIDPGIVLLTVHAERAKKDDEKAAWTAIIEKLGGLAASALIGLAAISAPPPAYAGGSMQSSTYVPAQSILCKIIKAGDQTKPALHPLCFRKWNAHLPTIARAG